jgi:hypothetical protein
MPQEQVQVYVAFDELMQDNEQRAHILKHVKHVSRRPAGQL